MASGEPYDKLEDTTTTDDKDELLLNDLGARHQVPETAGDDAAPIKSEASAIKKSKKVLEAGKAVLKDQSRGLSIIVICAFVFSVIITVALILSIYLGPPQIGANAAVATDVEECSQIGLNMIELGGNAMDAAVAAMFCVGVVNAESSGLGGGGFMLVHDHKTMKSEVFDFRETAPAAATVNMFGGDRSKTRSGGLTVGIPGELKGMATAHQKYGKLKWRDVVSPSADLARRGFRMTGHTENIFKSERFDLDKFMKSKLAPFYTRDGKPLKAGDYIQREDLAATLDRIVEHGADDFYTGGLANDIQEAVVNSESPGILTKPDLAAYKVVTRDAVSSTYHDFTIETVPAPGSGPALLSIMNLLEGYDLKENNLSYHRILEAFKFGYANKEKLGDPVKGIKEQIKNATKIMISKEDANRIRNKTAAVNMTMGADFYGNLVGLPEDKGTSHISVIDPAELIVSVTTTINDWFGSMVLTRSGILLNNQMADFSLSNEGNKLNEIAPGKRPLSSMVPTVVYKTDHACGLRMVVGGANGSRIITGVAETLINNLTFGMTLEAAIKSPRIHNQLKPKPKQVEVEAKFPPGVIADLESRGHVVVNTTEALSVVNAVCKVKDTIEAYSDLRKPGAKAKLFD